MQLNQRKAAIIGCGFVGSATAFCLMQSGLFSEIVLGCGQRKSRRRSNGYYTWNTICWKNEDICRKL